MLKATYSKKLASFSSYYRQEFHATLSRSKQHRPAVHQELGEVLIAPSSSAGPLTRKLLAFIFGSPSTQRVCRAARF
jgi:hypothetical protein